MSAPTPPSPVTRDSAAATAFPSFGAALRVWSRVALLSFGGPAGQIAVMHRILIDEKRWFSERRFLHALNYCMLLPGPEAQQLATYLGWLLHGWRGGLLAGLLFIAPGFFSMLALSIIYAGFHGTLFVTALFFGLKPAVVAAVVHALTRIGRRALRGPALGALALGSFVAMYFFQAPFPAVLACAALAGLALGRVVPGFATHAADGAGVAGDAVPPVIADDMLAVARPSWRRSLGIAAGGLAIWWAPVLALAIAFGPSHTFVQAGVFFGKVAVVTFGGAYAVLSYVAQEAVQTYQWLAPGEMLDGLGMAETTPGPLIMVVQFVGFMGAFRNPGAFDPMTAGVIGSVIVAWVTFVPCFIWIFLGAPYIERLRGVRALGDALSAVTAAVVGVILNLALWFGVHVLFGDVRQVNAGPLRFTFPDPATLDPVSALLTIAASVALFRLRWGLIPTLALCTLAGAAWVYIR
jgi:chromate transporter